MKGEGLGIRGDIDLEEGVGKIKEEKEVEGEIKEEEGEWIGK
ncbi:hypothetical protein [Leuconostoc mesenteroides]|nr:hypothetical protein [Leuconostoc mesenteroides]